MAGPTSSVLLKSIPSDLALGEMKNVIQKISSKVIGNDFWVDDTKPIRGTQSLLEGKPFRIDEFKIDRYSSNYTQQEIDLIEVHLAFNPKYALEIYAMCNQFIDHRILGELTLYLAEYFQGAIDFGGCILSKTTDFKGRIYEIPYETSEGNSSFYNVCDIEFMKEWLKHESFRMIK